MPIVRSGGGRSEFLQEASGVKENVKQGECSIYKSMTPRFSFEDLILSESVSNEIFDVLMYKQHEQLIFDEWGFNKTHNSHKKTALNFYGLPGTGKTMAAHAVATYLGKNIIEVNYAEIESKYVGDTPKNLQAVFDAARATDSVLFFDEADAILSKRVTNMSNSTDTSVNQTRSVMLMLLNNFDGVIVFATNFISNIDSAFMRRILGHVHFTMPDLEARKKIWNHLLPSNFPNDLDIIKIAEKFDNVSGSDISNAVLKTAFKTARCNEKIASHSDFDEAMRAIVKSKEDNSGMKVEKRFVSESYVKEQMGNKEDIT